MFFFLNLTVRRSFHRKDFKWKKYGDTGLIPENMEALYGELNERVQYYSVTGNFLQYIYFLPVTKNHQNIWSRCLVPKFSITEFFNNINHGYRAAMMKKNYLWLLPFYMVVATYFCCENVCRMMHPAIVSYLFK